MQAMPQSIRAMPPASPASPAPIYTPSVIDDARWAEIIKKLRAPFAAWEIKFRVQSGDILAYVSRDAVVRRLDEVVGAGNWTYEPEVVIQNDKSVLVAKGYLTIFGVTKASLGDASGPIEASKTSDSDGLKRAGAVFEIGAHLGYLAIDRVTPKIRTYRQDNSTNVMREDVARLRRMYQRGELWICKEVADYYGATFALSSNVERDDERADADTDMSAVSSTSIATSASGVDELADAALDDADAEIAASEDHAYTARVAVVTQIATKAGAQQKQIDWMLEQGAGSISQLNKALDNVLKALAKRKTT